MSRRWTKEEVDLLRKKYPICKNPRDLVAVIKHSHCSIRSKAKLLKLKRKVKVWDFFDLALKKKFVKLYPTHTRQEVMKKLKIGLCKYKNLANSTGIKKTEEFRNNNEKMNRFRKGNVSWNKGKKGIIFKGSERGWFKKGGKPHNTKSDGYISVRRWKTGTLYKWIRIAEGEWKLLHALNWEKAFGKIPEGKIVVFRTTDTMNCEPENLMLISREENMKRNTIHRYPDHVKQIIRASNKLKRTIEKQTT